MSSTQYQAYLGSWARIGPLLTTSSAFNVMLLLGSAPHPHQCWGDLPHCSPKDSLLVHLVAHSRGKERRKDMWRNTDNILYNWAWSRRAFCEYTAQWSRMFCVLIVIPWMGFYFVTACFSKLIVSEENWKAISLHPFVVCATLTRMPLRHVCHECWLSFRPCSKGLLHPQNFIFSQSLWKQLW